MGGEGSGALATLGAAMGKVVALEQQLSTALNGIAAVLPAFPAVRILDLDIGLPHAHAHPPNLIPPAPPVPLPSMGPVIPIPILSGASAVMINGLPAARCGDMGLGVWCGGYFPMYEIFLGSSNVWLEGGRAARLGVDITKHCIFTSPKPSDPPMGPMVGTTITGSFNVLIGGVPMPSLTALAMAGAFKLLGKLIKAGAKLAGRLAKRLGKNMKPGFLKCRILRAEPVNAVTGEVVVEQQDFELPGGIPLRWTRRYGSASTRVGLCGPGWETPADARLCLEDDGSVTFHDGGPGADLFVALPSRAPALSLATGSILSQDAQGFTVTTREGLSFAFPWPREGQREILVDGIYDLAGHALRFERRGGDLLRVTDGAGRVVRAICVEGRLSQLMLERGDDLPPRPLVTYRYDEGGRLAAVEDAAGHAARFSYEGGRLTGHFDRNGLGFYYAYDEADPEGRCVRAWGDGGLYDTRFEYSQGLDEHLDPIGQTRITDSLGHASTLLYDDKLLVFKEIDPLGGVIRYAYDEVGRTVEVVDPAHRKTGYVYDERGNLLAEVRPDGTRLTYRYDVHSRPIAFTDAEGHTWEQRWDARGLLVASISPLGAEETYTYDGRGQLVDVTDPLGRTTRLFRDHRGHVVALTDAAGKLTRLDVDELGHVTARTDPLGRKTCFTRDALGEIVEVRRPSGATVRCARDPEGNVVEVEDEAGQLTRIDYAGLGERVRVRRPDGTTVRYHYDTEERLIGVTNERGQTYHVRRDGLGRVVEEVDYWGQARRYEWDAGGRLTASVDPLGHRITYQTDPMGRIRVRELPGGAREQLMYDANGAVVGALTAEGKSLRELDAEGRVVTERQGGFEVTSRYDAAGNRIERRTRGGNVVRYGYDALDRVVEVAINDAPPVRIERDSAGQIRSEALAPGLSRRREWDEDGRLTHLSAQAGEGAVFSREYGYDARGELTRRASEAGIDRFRYDPVGRIREHVDPEGAVRAWLHDPAGDLLREVEAGEGAEGWRRVARLGASERRFDAAGQLRERIEGDERLRLDWDAMGRLVSSQRGDGPETTYGYDGQGRRAWKETGGQRIRFCWDGDALLGDQRPGEALREFVYYPGTFVPLAVVEPGGRILFTHNDPNGLPRQVTDAAGRVLWDARVSALGEVEALKVAHVDLPLRLQGQYYDEETGLHYNRHRYYDPRVGAFISQDPLGLEAGENLTALAPNVWGWVDPLGLQCTTHGNSKLSTRSQHRYEIVDSHGRVQKTGISGRDLNLNGSSPRANSQVNRLNKAAGRQEYSARVVETNIPGRQAALDAEQAATTRLAQQGEPLGLQRRPTP